MKKRQIVEGVHLLGAVDWDRRLFDALIPLPDGTSYNAYLVEGGEKTVLLDAVDPAKSRILLAQLAEVGRLDYVVCHHVEQDHSGAIPDVLARYPAARVLCSEKARGMIQDHLGIAPERIEAVADGQELPLGGKTLSFLYTPWVHWPETISTYLKEDKILFSCDFFGSHLATSDIYADEEDRVYEAAKRYYAEIMMPFRTLMPKNLERVAALDVRVIAPSHGPLYRRPAFIMDAYRDWALSPPRNLAVVAYVSMHGSTSLMAESLVESLAGRGVKVQQFELTTTDLGKLAAALVDASTLVLGTPTVLAGPHPAAVNAAVLANALRPKLKHAAIFGSYGWGGKAVETLTGLLPNLKVELLPPVLCQGAPREECFRALADLAAAIAERHGV